LFTPDHGLLLLCWILYCALHSALAVSSWKHWVEQHTGPAFKYYRIIYSIFATVSLTALLWYHFSFPATQQLLHAKWFNYVGIVFGIVGGFVMAICIRKYFFNLSGIDVFYKKKISDVPKLEMNGLHKFTRHPLYLGTLLFSWGVFLIWSYPQHLIANAVLTVYVLMAIRWEEKKLVREFGNEYREYASKVPRLFPWKLNM